MPRPAHALPRLLLLALMLCVGCTETDDVLVDDIGITLLFLTDPAQRIQSVEADPPTVQVARWDLASAALEIGGLPRDLLFGEPCTFSDTVLSVPIADGACGSGIVLGARTEPIQARLTLEIAELRVSRAEPVDLGGIDFDGDGVLSDGDTSGSAFDRPCGPDVTTPLCDDNCPLVPNPDQADFDEDGTGNACSVFDPFFGRFLQDSDADGVPDVSDNCVWIANPGQADTTGLSADGIPDQIGDACTEQTERIENIVIDQIVNLTQGLASVDYLTVDFNNQDALNCDFAGSCAVDPAQVRVCIANSLTEALGGCP